MPGGAVLRDRLERAVVRGERRDAVVLSTTEVGTEPVVVRDEGSRGLIVAEGEATENRVDVHLSGIHGRVRPDATSARYVAQVADLDVLDIEAGDVERQARTVVGGEAVAHEQPARAAGARSSARRHG